MAEKDVRKDVATIVSLMPFKLDEKKPGLYPGHFRMPAVKKGDIEILIIEEAYHFVPLVEQQPLRVPSPAGEVAKAIVSDFIEGALERDEDAWPGLFWVYGRYTPKEVAKAQLKDEIARAEAAQKNWFIRLVTLGDTEWAKNPGNHYSITDSMKVAAKYLNYERDWALDIDRFATNNCPVCQRPIHPKAIICEGCGKILNPEEYKKHEFAGTRKTA